MSQLRQQIILQEMGIGPLWLLRQPATIESEAVSAEIVSPQIAADTPEPQTRPQVPLHQPAAPILSASAIGLDQLETGQPAQAKPPFETLATSLATTQSPAQMTWTELAETVSGCRACGLCAGRQQTVFGVGDQQARWLFIGEGPGYNENLQGLPFVGEAGKLLDNMMLALGLQRGKNTYIANIVKCRPTDAQGKDRPPSAEEIAACLPYLQRQIALIQPDVIVALGKTAAIALLGLDATTPVSQLRGKVHRYQQIPMVATYHPAYLLRQPLEKAKAWQDLCQARALVTAS